MIDKQAGTLEIDVFSRGKYAVTMNGKSSGRKNRLEETPHADFLRYLKSTCCQRNDALFYKKMTYKPLTPFNHQIHQHLILTMRTQYEARPNS